MAGGKARREEIGAWAGLREIYARASGPRRRQLFLVLLLMLLGAAAELATIGAVIPFLALLADAGGARKHAWISAVLTQGHAINPLFVAAGLFILFAIFSGLIRIQLAWSSRRFIYRLGHELAVEIQRRVLLQPFTFHIDRNTSTLLSALNKTETLVYDILLPLMYAVTGGLIGLCVIALLLVVDPLTTLTVTAGFGLTYALISLLSRKRLAANSAIADTAYDARLQIVQESLGGVRDVILDNSQSLYLREFAAVDAKLADARAATQVIVISPRYVIEMVGMVVIAIIALIVAGRAGGITAALPILGALALGAQRLLPLMQEVYTGWSTFEGQRSIFGQIVELLQLPLVEDGAPGVSPFEIHGSVGVQEATFTYSTRSRPALDQVTLQIPRGRMVALVGPTGSGKSTLVDVLMGLLTPDSGCITVDDAPLTSASRSRWFRSIAHVPQSIFLSDTTIARNIALSVPNEPADQNRIVDAARKAQLHDFIVSLPAGYETYVGERGIRLSGGQRQRLGIARAIYKDAPLLILDEATSALDSETEKAVMDALERLRAEGRTIVIVAHRRSTVRHCDLVARLDRGRVAEFGPADDILGAGAGLS